MKNVEGGKMKGVEMIFTWAAIAVLCLVGVAGADDHYPNSQETARTSVISDRLGIDVRGDSRAKELVVIAQSANASKLRYSSWRSRSAAKSTVAEPDTEADTTTSGAKTATAAPVETPKVKSPTVVAKNDAPKAAAPETVAPKAKPVAPAPKKQVATQVGDFQSSHEVQVQPLSVNPDADPRGRNERYNIMRVITGKSLMLDLKSDAKRVSVANPDVAEVMIISPRQVMINGLSDGETTIIIWDNRGNYTMYSLVVGESLAEQVMLEVTVAEINRSAMERHGVDFRDFGGQFNVVTQYGNVGPTGGTFPPDADKAPFPLSLDGGISWAIVDTKNDIAAIFEQIQEENLGRILAEPKLLARSGKKASFLSGGEIPIVVTTNDDTSIEFKEFGTKIEFIPTVREDRTIDLMLQSEVSEPDFSAGVQLFGFTVPAFITRRTETEVTLRNQESLIVAGLIKETKQELESKMPFVGDIPFIGYFFRSTEYKNDILELVMVVKPKLVRPVEAGRRVALPTDRGPLTRSEVRTGPVENKVTRPRPY